MEYKLYLVLVSTVLGFSFGQLIIPNRPLGYVYSGSRDAPVHLDVHMGPLCPDSADVFPTLKQVANHYGSTNFILVLHMFPLPYHQQAFLVAKSAEIIKKYGPGPGASTAYLWFKYVYDHWNSFSNTNTANKTSNDIIAELANEAAVLGVPKNIFIQAMSTGEIEKNTRAAWKYSCTRGVASTPTFFLNDIIVEAESTWTLADWQEVINPMMKGLQTDRNLPLSSKEIDVTACPFRTVKCDYSPGKTECCTKGEVCIPNVGCRCSEEDC